MSDKEQRVDNIETAGNSDKNLRMNSGAQVRSLSLAMILVANSEEAMFS